MTELVTGLDLVQLQLRIAAGEALPFSQQDVTWRGSAMECRIYAEDPENQFLSVAGQYRPVARAVAGRASGSIRASMRAGRVPLEYDPLLAKLVAWAPDRNTAIQRLRRALAEYSIAGVKTNLALFQRDPGRPRIPRGQHFHRVRRRFPGATEARRAARRNSTRRLRWLRPLPRKTVNRKDDQAAPRRSRTGSPKAGATCCDEVADGGGRPQH